MNYLHRDIKPQNILLKKTKDGDYVLLLLYSFLNLQISGSQREAKMSVGQFWELKIICHLKFI